MNNVHFVAGPLHEKHYETSNFVSPMPYVICAREPVKLDFERMFARRSLRFDMRPLPIAHYNMHELAGPWRGHWLGVLSSMDIERAWRILVGLEEWRPPEEISVRASSRLIISGMVNVETQ